MSPMSVTCGRAAIHELKKISKFAMSYFLLSIIFVCACFSLFNTSRRRTHTAC